MENNKIYNNSLINPTKNSKRIAKIIAESGYCSRREAEKLILEHRVAVNGKIIDHPAYFITDESIKIDNKLLNPKPATRLFLFYKPINSLCTSSDKDKKPKIYDLLPKNLPRLISVGRLDFNTEGLLLLTNNGMLARYIELPKNQWIRKYRARVFGKLNYHRLDALKKGITIEGIKYKSIDVTIDNEKESNSWLTISLQEGKNREIRKIMQHLGLQVNRLIRTNFGPFELNKMNPLDIIEIPKKNIKNLFPINII